MLLSLSTAVKCATVRFIEVSALVFRYFFNLAFFAKIISSKI